MSPFRSIKGRALGKLLEGYKSSDIGKGFGAGGSSSGPAVATGGTKIIDGDYTYHVITSYNPSAEQNFTVLAGNAEVDWLVLGGGGGGSVQHSGGGGAGGLRSSKGPGGPLPSAEGTVTIPAGTTCSITIGAGGAKATTGPNGASPDGQPGGHTLWTIPTGTPIRAEGGGGAPSWDTNAGDNGGCGGGGNHGGGSSLGSKVANSGTSVPNQGYGGGSCSSGAHGGGGGGGTGQSGVNGTGSNGSNSDAGEGGNGQSLPAFPTTVLKPAWPSPLHTRIDGVANNAYGGGGGGGAHGSNQKGVGGNGGGGNGNQSSSATGEPGLDGYGGGGGGSGAYNSNPGGDGGTGLVIIRYST